MHELNLHIGCMIFLFQKLFVSHCQPKPIPLPKILSTHSKYQSVILSTPLALTPIEKDFDLFRV